MKKMLSLMLAISCILLTCIGCGGMETGDAAGEGATSGETVVWKMATQDSADSANGLGCEKFAELIAEKTDGRYQIEVHANGTLTTPADSIQDIQMGTIELSLVNVSVLTGSVEGLGVFDMPMLIKDNAQADAVTLDHLDYWQDMMEKEGGFSCLTIFETGWRTITNNKREIRSAADCEGLRIRVMQNNNYIDIWQRLGCDPVPMDMAEAFTAMQQGAIDGQDNPAIFCISNNIPEVNKYFSPINYIYSCIPVIMNTAAWDSLSSEDQEIFAECAYEAAVYQREAARQQEQEAYAEMEEKGVTITYDVDRESFQRILQPMVEENYDKYADSIDLINSCAEAA